MVARKAARTRIDPIPAYRPQLAQLVKAPPSGSVWLHELKYDGYRIGCRIEGRTITLISRTGKDWTAAFPEVVGGVRDLGIDSALLDGEVCMLLPDGRTSFQALQNAFSGGGPRGGLVYFVFDALHLDGRRLVGEPLEARKTALRARLADTRGGGVVQYADHLDADGPDAYREACRLGAEGIVSKRRDQPYQAGKRTGWLKTKCVHRQEFVIGGFTDPEGSRQGIGALLVGYYEGRRLVFAGKVGTGFTTATARELRGTLERIERRDCPFAPPPAGWLGRNAHWVRPALVCDVVFTEWTDEGKIRHPSFQGLRRDKAPASVIRERAAAASPAAAPRATASRPARRSASASAPAPADGAVVRGIRISHPDRLMFERPRMTKLDLVRYYDRVASAMMPHVGGRPLTLVRCGSGVAAGCMYMKHSKVWAPPALTRISVREKTKIGEYLVIETPEAIVALAQMDIVEIHTWNTRKEKIEYPDRIVIDLDPGDAIEWPTVVEAARLVRRLLHTLDLEGFVKTTGGRGLHVVIPLEPRHDWQACLAFARAVAAALVRHDPDRFTTTFGKRGRERQILVDYLRNNRTNTSVAAFSTRARAGAPVSVPVSWSEVTERLRPEAFTAATVPARLERQRKDPWAEYFTMKQRLPAKAVAALEGV